jgi:hypothetical protein
MALLGVAVLDAVNGVDLGLAHAGLVEPRKALQSATRE